MLPPLCGPPIRIELRRSLGPHLAATFIPRRLIRLDQEVLAQPGDFERILIHELFHFVWIRLSNALRLDWEAILAAERVPGELGWSAEWRKTRLTAADRRLRSPKWRRYARESFCDSAAWLYSGLARHDEFTLPAPARRLRRRWFLENLATGPVAI
ncbi:MAG TPA: hypothetical protein VMT15_15145 [Bryobacteraceae bacterium]|nr:hypothetical protein [Bryobacteraceae bacterium]